MKVKSIQVGPLATNCYILEDETAKLAAVIDPGDEGERILKLLEADGVKTEYILLTHGHYDHTTAVAPLHAALPDAKVYIHAADASGAGSYRLPLSEQIDGLSYYNQGDSLSLGALTIHVLHTPGHSLGSVTLRVADVLFTGDTLFAGSCGRTDLPGGDYAQILTSLKKLGQLEGDFHVLPGHEDFSTLNQERRSNPYLREAMGG